MAHIADAHHALDLGLLRLLHLEHDQSTRLRGSVLVHRIGDEQYFMWLQLEDVGDLTIRFDVCTNENIEESY